MRASDANANEINTTQETNKQAVSSGNGRRKDGIINHSRQTCSHMSGVRQAPSMASKAPQQLASYPTGSKGR